MNLPGRRTLLLLLGLLAAASAWALDPTRSLSQYHHKAWTVADGMPADIRAITQGPNGYLWLGTVNGLYRFDGVKVERMAAELLPSPSIRTLTTTPGGGLWIGYERPVGVISYLEGGVLKNYPIDAPSTTRIVQVVLGHDGTEWAATPETIFRFTGDRWEAMQSDWGTSMGLAPGGVLAFAVGRDGTVWSRNLIGLYYLRPGTERFVQARAFAGGPEAFVKSRDGTLWTTDVERGQLYALPELDSNSGFEPAPTRFGVKVPHALQGPILLDRHGSLWCASLEDGGICRIRGSGHAESTIARSGQFDRYTARDGLSSNQIHSLFEDREGNIWVGTSLGLDRFRPANVVSEGQVPAGFQSRFVEATPGVVYAYTGWSNTTTRETDGTESLYRIRSGQPPELLVPNVGRLRGIFHNSHTGDVLVVHLDGVRRLDENGRLGPAIELPEGVAPSNVYSVAEDRSGDMWLSAFVHGVWRRQPDGPWTAVPIRSRTAATAVLIPTPDGAVWARYSGGTLYRLKGDHIEDLSDNDARIGDITLIAPHSRGLVFGGEGGIALFDGRRFHSLSAVQEPDLNVVTGITNTPEGTSWIFTQAGVLRIATDNLLEAMLQEDVGLLQYELMDSIDGLPGAPYGAIYGKTVARGDDGRIWLTTGAGLAWIDPNNHYRNPLPPPVKVTSISVEGKSIPAGSPLELGAGTRNVAIDYTALSLMAPERVQFRYRLEGVDDDWVDAGPRRQAFYTRLGPGDYTFQVMAANGDGLWNREGDTLAFTIPPTFLQSGVFAVLCALATAGAIVLLFWIRLRKISARMKLQLEVRMLERERIARELHDTLLQGFQGLMLRFQAVADRIPRDQPTRVMLEEAMARGDEVLTQGRDRVYELRGTVIEEELEDVLRNQLQQFAGETAAELKLEIRGKGRPLHPVASDEIAAICNEALANAVRHARANHIEVRVEHGRNGVQVAIIDDGIGIEGVVVETGRPGHFGLAGMRERARRIRADLLLLTRPGGGTRVEVRVPASTAYARQSPRRTRHAIGSDPRETPRD